MNQTALGIMEQAGIEGIASPQFFLALFILLTIWGYYCFKSGMLEEKKKT